MNVDILQELTVYITHNMSIMVKHDKRPPGSFYLSGFDWTKNIIKLIDIKPFFDILKFLRRTNKWTTCGRARQGDEVCDQRGKQTSSTG